MSWLQYLNPMNWAKDLSNSFISQFEHALLYVFSLILDEFLSLLNSVFGYMMGAFQGSVMWLVSVSVSLGPFSVPFFVIAAAAIISVSYLSFRLVKDMPVVGAFV